MGILKSATTSGFILTQKPESLRSEAIEKPILWYRRFDEFQRQLFVKQLEEFASELVESTNTASSEIGIKLGEQLGSASPKNIEALVFGLIRLSDDAGAQFSNLLKSTDEFIDDQIRTLLEDNMDVLEELSAYVEELDEKIAVAAVDNEIDEDDEESVDELEESQVESVETPFQKGHREYKKAVRAKATSVFTNRKPSKNSKSAQVIDWLGDERFPDNEVLELIFRNLQDRRALNRFRNPVASYLNTIPRRYRQFRREARAERRWYSQKAVKATQISPLEVDILILATINAARSILLRPTQLTSITQASRRILDAVESHFKAQILVDEVTDFSPVQIACIARLAHPSGQSFFACGDFNQRLTEWGATSKKDIEWAVEGIETREINIAYRQSPELNQLSKAISALESNEEVVLAEDAKGTSGGISPVLIENLNGHSDISVWLADRIYEIESFLHLLPSIAVFVGSEDQVAPVAEALNAELSQHNLQAIACRDGKVVGLDTDIRVFDIQHIKGLEFEAVFFVGIDNLAGYSSSLFNKILFVGSTRAATYLGISCEKTLPKSVESLRPHFASSWRK